MHWSPTGINVPDYPKLAQIWWQQIGDVNSGAFTPQEAMDRLAEEMDVTMARMQAADESANVYGGCGPRLNEEKDPSEWLGKQDGPKAKLENEKPQGETIDYDELVKRWTQPVRLGAFARCLKNEREAASCRLPCFARQRGGQHERLHPRDRPGHDLEPRDRVRRRDEGRRLGQKEFTQHYPGLRLGRARSGGNLAERRLDLQARR